MRKIELVFWILLWMVLATFGQEKRIPVESWERRLNQVQPPEEIMDAIGLKPGMIIGDIGAGRGRLAVWFADRVGPEGKIYANDIDEDALAHLQRRCQQHAITNVETILGEIEDPRLPEKSLDIAFMINVYHHLDKPVELVRNIRPSLKSDGILAIVDADPKKSGLDDHHSTPKKDMLKQLDKAGYRVIRIDDFLQLDYIYICRPK